MRSTAQKFYRPVPLCRSPIARESPETAAFLALLHGRERIDEDCWRRLKGELVTVLLLVVPIERDVSLLSAQIDNPHAARSAYISGSAPGISPS